MSCSGGGAASPPCDRFSKNANRTVVHPYSRPPASKADGAARRTPSPSVRAVVSSPAGQVSRWPFLRTPCHARLSPIRRASGAYRRTRQPRLRRDPGPPELGPMAGRVAPKSRAGRRMVPVPPRGKHLLERRLARGRRGGLVSGRPNGRPFSKSVAQSARNEELDSGRPRAGRPRRMPPHGRLADDRRRGQRQGPLDLPRPYLRDDHARPLRPPVPGLRARRPRDSSTPISSGK
jgi:hypothetical protein